MRHLLAAFLLIAAPAAAQDFPLSEALPQCGPATGGRAMCREGVAYECHLVAPASTRPASGWLWEANILLPCEAHPAPADLPDGPRLDLPPGFVYAPQYNSDQGGQAQTPLPQRRPTRRY